MAKSNIDFDLLRILKSKPDDELFYTLLNMLNGTYDYEVEYINNVPYEVILIYLEKIIVCVSKSSNFDVINDFDIIFRFCENVKGINEKQLRANLFLNMKYYFKVNLKKIEEPEYCKKFIQQASCFVFACFICCSLYQYMSTRDISDNSNEPTTPPQEINETLAYETDPTKQIIEMIEPIVEMTEPIIQEPTHEEKVQYILETYNLTPEEFDILCAIVLTEAKENSYDDVYYTINTVYNRTISKKWIRYISNNYGEDTGFNLYYQAIMPGQFVVYQDGLYKANLGVDSGVGYQAIIDFLYNPQSGFPNIKHNFLSFKSADSRVEGSVQLVDGGNRYHNELTEEDRIELENKLVR